MKFEDLYTEWDRADDYYRATNEDPLVWRDLVRGLRVNYAGAICSGGEVGFFALLPTVRKELVLIDHSYKSMSFAMIKYLLLQRLGAERTRQLLTETPFPSSELQAEVTALKDVMPEKIRHAFEYLEGRGHGGLRERYDDPARGIIPDHWSKLPSELITVAAKKLDKVVFAHGDLSDLRKWGGFDLLYLSNAFEHTSRFASTLYTSTAKNERFANILRLVKPGGYLLISSGVGSGARSDLELMTDGGQTHGGCSWTQRLYRRPLGVRDAVAA